MLLNKKLIFCSLFLSLLLPVLAFGQRGQEKNTIRKGQNEIEFSFTPQYYFNRLNVHNDGVIPNLISAKNRLGLELGLDYYRITHYGLVYGAGFCFGQIGQDVTINYKNWDFFYPKDDYPVMSQFLAAHHTFVHIKKQLNYLAFRPNIGYRFRLPGEATKGWDFQIDAGIDFLYYMNGASSGSSDTNGLSLTYLNAASDTLFAKVPLLGYNYDFGKSPFFSFWDQHYRVMYELNLEISKDVDWGFVRNFNIGIKITYSGNGMSSNPKDIGYFQEKTSGSGFVKARAYDYRGAGKPQSIPISVNQYRARDFSFGLKFGIGLWPDKR